ncbi:MAG: lysophospholipid acyltransferase family protein [bacterium JZ-2024 1]
MKSYDDSKPPKDLPALSVFLWWSFKPVLFAASKVYLRLGSEGRENIPRRGPVLIVSNHLSHLDPPVLGITCPRPVRFMAREDLRRAPVVGPLIRRWGVIPVYRENRRAAASAVKLALVALQRGDVVAIFPEGTRSETGRLQPEKVRSGAAVLALESDATVVPAGIVGSHKAFPKSARFIRPYPVFVRYGTPLDLSQYRGRPPTPSDIREVTLMMLNAIQSLIPEDQRAPELRLSF